MYQSWVGGGQLVGGVVVGGLVVGGWSMGSLPETPSVSVRLRKKHG